MQNPYSEESMKEGPVTEDLLRQYLLGQLPEEKAERIEMRLMADAAFRDALTDAEQDLADDYASGTLGASAMEGFESVFLAHPERRRLLAFSQALRRYIEVESAGITGTAQPRGARPGLFDFLRAQSPGFRLASASALLIIAVMIGTLAYQVYMLRQSLAGALSRISVYSTERDKLADDLQRERARSEKLDRELTESKAGRGSADAAVQKLRAGVVAITLFPGMIRDTSGTQRIERIVFPLGTDLAELTLVLEDAAYQIYDAELQTAEGKPVWNATGLQVRRVSGQSAVVVQVTRDVLQPQDYLLRLSGIKADGSKESAGMYYLRIDAR